MLQLLERLAERGKAHLYLWVALAVVTPRLVFVLAKPERSLSGNAPAMIAIADHLLAGAGFTDDTGQPDGHFSPLYVGLLAGCRWLGGERLLLIKLAQIAFDVFTAIVLCRLLARLGSTLMVMLFALAFALHPLLLYYVNNVNEECLLTLAVAVSFVAIYNAIERPSHARFAGAGLALGLATMVKGSVVFLPLVVAAFGWWLSRTRWSHWVAYLSFYILVLVPWAWRNHVVFGAFAINPRGFGQSLWWGSDPRIFASYGGDRNVAVDNAINEMAAKGLAKPSHPGLLEIERWQFRMGLENYRELLRHPADMAKLFWLKTSRTLYASENRPSGHWMMILLQIPVIGLAALGWQRMLREEAQKLFARLSLLYVGYFFVVVSAGMPLVRYFLPAIPLMLMTAAVGLSLRDSTPLRPHPVTNPAIA